MRLASQLYVTPGHIRSRLFRDLVLLVLFTVGLLILVGWFLTGQLKRELAGSQIAAATALVRDEIRALISPVEQQLLITRDGLRAADLTPDDQNALNQHFRPVLLHVAQIAGISLAVDSGAEYFLLREHEEWVGRERSPGDTGSATWTRWSTEGAELDTRSGPLDYDPRRRPWFAAALDAEGRRVTWSAPYIFHRLQVPGITASIAWEQDGVTRVLAMDVLLSRIVQTLDKLSLGGDGRGFLLNSDGGLYLPGQQGYDATKSTASQFFSSHKSLGGPLLFDAIAAWEAAGRPAEELIRFRSQRRDWWGGFLPLSPEPDTAWIGVARPTSETLGVLQSRWQILALTSLAIVASGVGLVLVLMRKYSRQLRDLPKLTIDRANYAQDLDDLIRNGEDMHLELKSTMRTNLHTGRPGKEVELAWLKGAAAFMNSDGGILLMGVADDGSLVGLEADKFENEDRCRLHFKNLFNQHLGAENARFVRFDLYELEGRKIGAVECERANLPVYLHTKNTESFLIRNGPSNIELTISRAVKYIQGRF
ncbi:MAG: putative DNA binding domain-containing protein [Chromatiaceae bacterium]|nr:putative DNA binding domain-containing protein [Chromatiaceae bacterium]